VLIGIGAIVGLLCAWVILVPLGQCLVDYDDDDVVLYTILYLKYVAIGFSVVCSLIMAWQAGHSFGPMGGRSRTSEKFRRRSSPVGSALGSAAPDLASSCICAGSKRTLWLCLPVVMICKLHKR
jgi:hypothetical protein